MLTKRPTGQCLVKLLERILLIHARKNPSWYQGYQDGAAGSQGFGTTDPTCIRGIKTGLQDLTGSKHQIVYAYEVSGRGCRISRVRNNKSNIPRRYQDEAAGSHEFGTPYRTCLEGIRTGLQDLMGSEHQIVHAYDVSGRSCRFSRVRTSDRTCI